MQQHETQQKPTNQTTTNRSTHNTADIPETVVAMLYHPNNPPRSVLPWHNKFIYVGATILVIQMESCLSNLEDCVCIDDLIRKQNAGFLYFFLMRLLQKRWRRQSNTWRTPALPHGTLTSISSERFPSINDDYGWFFVRPNRSLSGSRRSHEPANKASLTMCSVHSQEEVQSF